MCICEYSKEVVLKCGHSFCCGCISKIKWKQRFNKKGTNPLDAQSFRELVLECPKCLAQFGIGTSGSSIETINLPCDCTIGREGSISDVLVDVRVCNKVKGMSCLTVALTKPACKKHDKVLSNLMSILIYGSSTSEAGTLNITLVEMPSSAKEQKECRKVMSKSFISTELKLSNLK